MKIQVFATAEGMGAVVSLRVDGRQVAQIEHRALTAAEAMTNALAETIGALAVETVRNAERVLRLAPSDTGRETP